MPEATAQSWLELLDWTLIVIGAVCCVGGAARLTFRRGWTRFLKQTHVVPNRFGLLDVLAPFVLAAGVSGLCYELAAGDAAGEGIVGPTTKQDAERPAGPVLDVGAAAWANLVGSLGGAALLLVLGRMRVDGGLRGWGLNGERGWRVAFRGAAAFLVAWPICMGLLVVTRWLVWRVDATYEPPMHQTLELLSRAAHERPVAAAGLMLGAALAAPMMEELLFRGVLQTVVATASGSAWAGIWLSALTFGAMHVRTAETVPAMVALGVVLGYVYARWRSLATVIAAHVLFNLKTLVWFSLGAGGPG